jgi:hypothetical protein
MRSPGGAPTIERQRVLLQRLSQMKNGRTVTVSGDHGCQFRNAVCKSVDRWREEMVGAATRIAASTSPRDARRNVRRDAS